MTLGSLFDGIGGFPLAGLMCGIKPVWSSEIEPFPLKVTAARFPDMKQLGSVTDINGAEVEPVDIITFGSPCQDLSVAGKQKGIHDGERSNLFFEAVRIIKEMRDATRSDDHIRPRFAVWENVPGAFSSNGGEDFKAVLEALAGVMQDGLDIPRPKKWNHAGGVAGDGWSIAWRVYDAQYWGVPQRRKRIYLVADFGSERAGEILFEREGVSGDSQESRAPWEGATADAERSVGRNCLFEPLSLLEENWSEQTVKNALRANASRSGHCIVQDGVKCLNPWDCQSKRQHDINGAYPTLQAYNGGGGRCDGVVYPINTMVATRGGKDDMRTCFGIGEPGDPQFTISAAHEHGVCYPNVARTLAARHDSSPCVDRGQNVIAIDCRNMVGNEELSATLQAKNEGGFSLNFVNPICYRAGGYGDMVEGVGTLRANGGDVGGGYESIVIERVVYDGRGNGDGDTVPTMAGDHFNRPGDFSAVLVEKHE